MIGDATNCEIDGSSGGAVDGLKPSAASDGAIEATRCGTAGLGGTAGSAPGGGAGAAATGAKVATCVIGAVDPGTGAGKAPGIDWPVGSDATDMSACAVRTGFGAGAVGWSLSLSLEAAGRLGITATTG